MISEVLYTVVITAYNRAQLLKRALDSLILQTETDWEAIVVDDGSTDDTFAEIMMYLRSSDKIRYLWKSHSGNAPSRNHGIMAAAGRFITFLDSDDEYHPAHLETRKKILTDNPTVKFLYGGVKILGSQFVPDKDNPHQLVNLKDCAIGGSYIIERRVLLGLNGFRNIMLGSDADLFERAVNGRIPMKEVTHPTYIYHHENQESTTNMLCRKLQTLSLKD